MFFTAREAVAYFNDPGRYHHRHNVRRAWGLPTYDGPSWVTNENVPRLTLTEARRVLRQAKARLTDRDTGDCTSHGLGKWYRPWHVVPALREWRPPAGKFGVGVELELGFSTAQMASAVVSKVLDWKYVAVDYEGTSNYPAEITFPPEVHGTRPSRSRPFRFLRLLREHAHLGEALTSGGCGAHINVSHADLNPSVLGWRERLNSILRYNLSGDDKLRYFGRREPYGYCYDHGRWVEWKLCQTSFDEADLKKYITVCVTLTQLLIENEAHRWDRSYIVQRLDAALNSR